MRAIVSLLVVGFLMLSGARAGNEALVKKELEALRGNWTVENDDGVQTRFSMVDNSLQIRVGGNSKDFTFKVNPAKKPKQITITFMLANGADKSMLGIYKLEGDTLKICFGEKRPTEFKAEAKRSEYFELKREKKKEK